MFSFSDSTSFVLEYLWSAVRTDYDGIDVQRERIELVHERMELGRICLLGIEEVVTVILVGPAEDGALKLNVTNQGIGPQRTDTEPPCYKGNERRTRSFGFPTGLGPDGPWEIHAVTL